jgi:tRNA nucleotidyltransferase (CCA-adding enzyme)
MVNELLAQEMKIILTHEQADFDAVASMLAARILNPEALPILPRRLNRNVRAYLTLYGDGLPFIEFGDIKPSPLADVILVDTQSLISVKGFSEETNVHVVDHHPISDSIDSKWTIHIEETGAATTLLVEDIQELGLELDLVSATMLLLGIYEDTGSLTYGTTTARDARACAWLLENGGNLEVAVEFLNHPLSNQQRELYDRLTDAIQIHSIHGYTIVVAAETAKGFSDEISTIAHKLRDLYDPTGLFVLVNLNEHIQLVARSTSDVLNVATITAHFGGGGHSRASAALIRGRSLESVISELLDLLPEIVQPEMTVEEIMSRGPQILDPGVSIQTASQQMQRFGHEGYPVVDDGRIVGLLTRRAVDRAMSHGMKNRPISSIMDAGTLSVFPSDSVKQLQQVMIESSWGQVPVVDPQKNEIVGIVTRTDLLKNLTQENGVPERGGIDHKLESALPDPVLRLLRIVANESELQKSALYIVGGFVRDLILGIPGADFDLVVEGDAISLGEGLVEKYGGRISSHRRFGTAKWNLELSHSGLQTALGLEDITSDSIPNVLDLVSARTEFYTYPTALPSVQKSSIKLDLHRRDFSINTLAIRLDGHHYGELQDHWGGGRDLRDSFIRVLHSLSFVDDPTRMLRAVRLEQRLGFTIEPRTLELLHEALPLLDRVSGERIRSELEQVFHEREYREVMARLKELGLLESIHTSLTWNAWMAERISAVHTFLPPENWRVQSSPSSILMIYTLMMLQADLELARGFCNRLHFPAVMRKVILEANKLAQRLPKLCESGAPSEFVEAFGEVSEEAIFAIWLGMHEDERCRIALSNYMSEWRYVSPKSTGDTLRELGLPPGPAYRVILSKLRGAWLDGEISDPEQEERLLNKLVKAFQDDSKNP